MSMYGIHPQCGSVSDVHSLCLVKCFMENQRSEIRPIDGSGQIVSALPASSGGRQFNIILQERAR